MTTTKIKVNPNMKKVDATNSKVVKEKLDKANQILKEVLGVSVSIPEWATRRLESIVAKFDGADVTPSTLNQLRAKLSEAGFTEYYPEALARLVQNK